LQGTLALVGAVVASVGPAVDSEKEHALTIRLRILRTARVR
jgi:hypothetical protein